MWIRNDNCATTLVGANGDVSQKASIDSVGRQYTAPGTVEATYLYGSIAFGSITGTFQSLVAASSNRIKIIDIYNGTDAVMLFTFDGTNTHFAVPAGAGKIVALALGGVHETGDLSIKQASAPTSGSVYATAVY